MEKQMFEKQKKIINYSFLWYSQYEIFLKLKIDAK